MQLDGAFVSIALLGKFNVGGKGGKVLGEVGTDLSVTSSTACS